MPKHPKRASRALPVATRRNPPPFFPAQEDVLLLIFFFSPHLDALSLKIFFLLDSALPRPASQSEKEGGTAGSRQVASLPLPRGRTKNDKTSTEQKGGKITRQVLGREDVRHPRYALPLAYSRTLGMGLAPWA